MKSYTYLHAIVLVLIFVYDEKFHRNIKTLLLIIQFCLCTLNSPRSKYFINFSLMVFDSQICSANAVVDVKILSVRLVVLLFLVSMPFLMILSK